MTNINSFWLGSVLAIAMAPAAFAQDASTGTTAPAVAVDCSAEFTNQDIDGNGFLSETEAPRAYARSRLDGATMNEAGDTELSLDQYTTLCNGANWAENIPEEGAPFAGSNSFTEAQARDRAVAWNVTEISALVLDDQGIWRGTGMAAGKPVSIAIDYKGNVVTSAPQP